MGTELVTSPLNADDTEYVSWGVRVLVGDGEVDDYDAVAVGGAFVTGPEAPFPDDWIVAEWEAQGVARLLVGATGAVELTAGYYTLWTQVSYGAETVTRRVGPVLVV